MFKKLAKWWTSPEETETKITFSPKVRSELSADNVKDKAAHFFKVRLYYQNKELHYPGYEPQLCVMYFHGIRWNDTYTLENLHTITFPRIHCHIRVDSFGICDTDGTELFRSELGRYVDMLPLGKEKYIELEFVPGAIRWTLTHI